MKYLTWLWLLISLLVALLFSFGVLDYNTRESFWDRVVVSALWFNIVGVYINNILDNKLKTLKEENDAS